MIGSLGSFLSLFPLKTSAFCEADHLWGGAQGARCFRGAQKVIACPTLQPLAVTHRWKIPVPDETLDQQDIWAIDDYRVPLWVREHGLRFRYPAAFVECLGDGEYVLFGDDGEMVDMVYRADQQDPRE